MNAKEYRKLAWERLGQGGWSPFILGVLSSVALMSAIMVAQFVVQLLVQQQSNCANGGNVAATGRGGLVLAMLTVLFARIYVQTATRYGVVSLAIAVMRRGARFGHALSGYGKVGRTLWLQLVSGMYVLLWSLLLIVPGIRALFSYRMAPFLLIDHPELSTGELIARSKQLMEGNRWRLFCLDISFIGWWLLCVCTLGIAMIFVFPYYLTAIAAFYEDLLDKEEAPVAVVE